ncbi:MAG: ABC transporter permease [Verrucomicrobia bacterium]|nr:ABC transporter permease [Verrucomicrobiota bacterium]
MNSRTPQTPERVIRPARGLVPIDFAELWRYRELFLFLSWRDILIRYKQTALGIAWAVLQPLLNTFVFVLVFDKLGNFDSKGAPYAVMALAGLIPWQFFANALGESSNSLVASSNMVTKIYFPRLIIPASAVLSGVVDLLVSLMILAVTMLWFGLPFRWSLLGLPLFLLIAFSAAFAAGVWLSALNVNYRDVKYVVPFFTRMGIYLSPVGYLSTLILDKFGPGVHFLYCLNPMVGVIDGFRWCILGDAFQPNLQGLAASGIATMLLLVTGMFYFRSTEKTFADVI